MFLFGFGMVAWSATARLFMLIGKAQPAFGLPLLIALAIAFSPSPCAARG
jgi:hypothetical protein